jgi:hypothetical protein
MPCMYSQVCSMWPKKRKEKKTAASWLHSCTLPILETITASSENKLHARIRLTDHHARGKVKGERSSCMSDVGERWPCFYSLYHRLSPHAENQYLLPVSNLCPSLLYCLLDKIPPGKILIIKLIIKLTYYQTFTVHIVIKRSYYNSPIYWLTSDGLVDCSMFGIEM